MTGLVGVSVGTGGVSLAPMSGVSDEPQGFGVESSGAVGGLGVETAVPAPAASATGQAGTPTVTLG